MINLLTLSRVILLLPLAWVMLGADEKSWAAVMIFLAGGITDFLDGWLARRLGKTSEFGAMLDQICDKIFVVGSLVLMVAAGLLQNWMLLPVLLVIAREFFVSGLREYAARQGRAIPVDKWGKIKTALQFIGIALMLLPAVCHFCIPLNHAGAAGLWMVAALGCFSAVRYFSAAKSRG